MRWLIYLKLGIFAFASPDFSPTERPELSGHPGALPPPERSQARTVSTPYLSLDAAARRS